MLGNICRDSGTGTKQTGTGTPKQEITSSLLVPVPHLMVPVPTCNFAGFEHNSNFGARARLSFDHHFEMMKEKGI